MYISDMPEIYEMKTIANYTSNQKVITIRKNQSVCRSCMIQKFYDVIVNVNQFYTVKVKTIRKNQSVCKRVI